LEAFSGAGQSLGSTTTTSNSTAITPQTTDSQKHHLELDQSKPVTTIQIRLYDGTRIVTKFNHHHTVQHIRNFVESAKRIPTGKTFELMTTFPKQVLNNTSISISDAKLLNAVIVQSLN